jgi:hypothetical protein
MPSLETAKPIARSNHLDTSEPSSHSRYRNRVPAPQAHPRAKLSCGVIHDWDDDQAAAILRNCRRAMAENSRLLLVDMVVPDNGVNCFSKLLDLNMLVMNGVRERIKCEFCALLDAADYKLTRIVSTGAPQSMIEAMAK